MGKIKTTCDGRIFYLDIAGKQVKDQDAVAIIGEPSDTREEVLKWYKEIKR